MTIFTIFVALALIGLAAYALQLLAVRSLLSPLHFGAGAMPPRSFPPISILKPLKGLDDNLYNNLESFCLQDYPAYEIIFSLQDYNDPACKVAKMIKDKHPERDITIMVEHCSAGLNPKVNNLIPAYRIAKHDCVLVSDSNVLVAPSYLSETARHLDDPNVGLVSNLIKGSGARSLGSLFENLHINSFIIGSVCFLDRFLKMPCVIGKSMLMRKADLEAAGGFMGVKDVLAEDYILGKRIAGLGKKVAVSGHLITNVNEYWGLGRFLNRHTRWGKLRWKIGGPSYFSELLGNPVFMASLPLFFCGASRTTISFALLVSILKILGDLYIGRLLTGDAEDEHRTGFLSHLLTPCKDLLVGIIWFVPLLSNTVMWRGNRYAIGKDSVLSPSAEEGLGSWRYRLIGAIRGRAA